MYLSNDMLSELTCKVVAMPNPSFVIEPGRALALAETARPGPGDGPLANLRPTLQVPADQQELRRYLAEIMLDALKGFGVRVLIQGSVMRDGGYYTDLPTSQGKVFDLDVRIGFDSVKNIDRQKNSILTALKQHFATSAYSIKFPVDSPFFRKGDLLILAGHIDERSGKKVCDFEVALGVDRHFYVDKFREQMQQVQAIDGVDGVNQVLEDIRLMKLILKTLGLYKYHENGFIAIAAEQLILTSAGVDANNALQGVGSIHQAMQWLERQGYDAKTQQIHSLASAKANFRIVDEQGNNFLDILNDGNWRRLIHAARRWNEPGPALTEIPQLEYRLTDAQSYRHLEFTHRVQLSVQQGKGSTLEQKIINGQQNVLHRIETAGLFHQWIPERLRHDFLLEVAVEYFPGREKNQLYVFFNNEKHAALFSHKYRSYLADRP